MKNLFILALFLVALSGVNLFAQNPGFTRTDPEWVQTYDTSYEAKSHATVNNPYGAPTELRVIIATKNIASGWDGVGICDINNCYAVGLDTVTAIYPAGNSEIYLYFSKQIGLSGASTCIAFVERVSNPTQKSGNVTFGTTTGVIGINQISSVVREFSLEQNYPNPFNPVTNINFSIPKSEFVSLRVFDMLGREVKSLVSQEMTAGQYNVDFDASGLSSGMYYYSLRAGDNVSVKKMVLVK